jgi:ABC-type uncharacterized transport system fused permease/ATPase subunit
MENIYNFFQIDDGSIFSKAAEGGVIWNPLLLLLILVIISLIIYLFGKLFFNDEYNKDSGQVKPFNSGNVEEMRYTVKAENLYWGFRDALKSYYKTLNRMHTGDLTDYIKWWVITTAVVLLLINGGLL